MNNQTQINFWNTFASKYDRFISRFAKSTYISVEQLLKEDLHKSDKVLEIGTGTGIIAFAVASHVREITALDSASEMIAVAKGKLTSTGINNITFQLGNANNTGLPDNYFDAVIASNVFHLLEAPELALREIHRVLKDTGKAILPTYCHGHNIKSRVISSIMGLSGFRAENRWSAKTFRDFVEKEQFVVLKEIIIKDKIPLSYLLLSKHKPNIHD